MDKYLDILENLLLLEDEYEWLDFKEAFDKNLISSYIVDNFDNLSYADNEQDAKKNASLCLLDGKTYLYLKTTEDKTTKIKINLGDTVYISSEKKTYIAEYLPTNKFQFIENGKILEISENTLQNDIVEIGDMKFESTGSINNGT